MATSRPQASKQTKGSSKKKKRSKVSVVMGEFESGKLKSSSGQKVTNKKQAIAIALSESRKKKRKK